MLPQLPNQNSSFPENPEIPAANLVSAVTLLIFRAFSRSYCVFLFPWKISILSTFRKKSSGWLKILFFVPLFFFCFRIWVSERIINFSWFRKKHISVRKKNTVKVQKYLFVGDPSLNRVSGFQTFPEKKNASFFFQKFVKTFSQNELMFGFKLVEVIKKYGIFALINLP